MECVFRIANDHMPVNKIKYVLQSLHMSFELPKKEILQEKIKRLRPVFENSLETQCLLAVTRELSDGTKETISGLVTIEINEDGPELASLDENGDCSASATMLWREIIEVEMS